MRNLGVASMLMVAACSAPQVTEPRPEPRPEPAPDAPVSAESAAEKAPVAKHPVGPDVALGAAGETWRELVPSWVRSAALVLGRTEPVCSEDECAWELRVVEGGDPNAVVGTVWVDASTAEVAWEANDGTGERWKPEAFKRNQREAGEATDLVASFPDVKAYCARMNAQGTACTVRPDRRPTSDRCPATPTPADECLWAVYVGEAQSTHTVRFATFFVDVAKKRVIGASTMACDASDLPTWRRRIKRQAAEDPCKP